MNHYYYTENKKEDEEDEEDDAAPAPTARRDTDIIADVSGDRYYAKSWEFLSVPMMVSTSSSRVVGEPATAAERVTAAKSGTSFMKMQKGNTKGFAMEETLMSIDASDPVRDNNNNKNDLKWVWDVKELKSVPLYHPISPSESLTIIGDDFKQDNASPSLVASRISNFMYRNSITCYYYDPQDPGRVDCLTQELLRFTVHLWKGKTKGSIIVEVLHTQGSQMEMHKLRGKLFHAIEVDKEESEMSFEDMTTGLENKRDIPFSNIIQQSNTDVTSEEISKFQDYFGPYEPLNSTFGGRSNDLTTCLAFLQSGREDQTRYALNTLCLLTDPLKESVEQVDHVSRTLVFGDENGNTDAMDALERFFSGIETPNGDGTADTEISGICDDGNNHKTLRYAQGEFFGMTHLMALRVLSQALESVVWQKEKSTITLEHSNFNSLFWKMVEDSLMYNLEVANCRPLEAALSAKCIRLIQSLEPQSRNFPWKKTNLLPSLLSAHRYGRAHHLWLEQESKYLIGRLTLVH